MSEHSKYKNRRIAKKIYDRHTKKYRLRKSKFWKSLLISGLIIFILLCTIIPLRLAITLIQIPKPQAIFVLDGNSERVRFAGEFWQWHSNLDIWISGCTSNIDNPTILKQMGVPQQKVYFDLRAIDTVGHFTTMAETFIRQKIWHVYLITSDYHMSRSWVIASLVFGSRGIAVSPIPVPSNNVPPEPIEESIRDAMRSLLWIFFDSTGEKLAPMLWQKKLVSCSANWPLPLDD